MRKGLLLLVAILTLLCGYSGVSVFAQSGNEGRAIKEVIENFFKRSAACDLEGSMKDVAADYFDEFPGGKTIDYAGIKEIQQRLLEYISVTYRKYSIEDIEIIESGIQAHKARVKVKFLWFGFNAGTSMYENGKQKRVFGLTKENDAWKITRVRWVE